MARLEILKIQMGRRVSRILRIVVGETMDSHGRARVLMSISWRSCLESCEYRFMVGVSSARHTEYPQTVTEYHQVLFFFDSCGRAYCTLFDECTVCERGETERSMIYAQYITYNSTMVAQRAGSCVCVITNGGDSANTCGPGTPLDTFWT